MVKDILDPASGSRMFYFDKEDPRVLFGDIRQAEQILCDGRALVVDPDLQMDFRAMPFRDDSFSLVIFDPPHLRKAGSRSYMALKYGVLGNDWETDLTLGFAECFRVLKPGRVLVFKWNETQIKTSQVLKCTPQKPVCGHISGKRSNTHWILFLKSEQND